MTSDGSAYTGFRRALTTGNVDVVHAAAVDGGGEPSLQLSEEAVARFFDQVMTIYIVPEIDNKNR